jgi:hypothetical protein
MNRQQEEVDKNWEEFRKILPSIIAEHRDKYALMKNQKVIGFFSSPYDAKTAAESFIEDGIYSIQHVTDAALNIGYFTYAIPLDPIQP